MAEVHGARSGPHEHVEVDVSELQFVLQILLQLNSQIKSACISTVLP